MNAQADVFPFHAHTAVPCVVLDEWAHLPTDEQIALEHQDDILAVYIELMRKAKIHLEQRMEMLREEEDAQAKR